MRNPAFADLPIRSPILLFRNQVALHDALRPIAAEQPSTWIDVRGRIIELRERYGYGLIEYDIIATAADRSHTRDVYDFGTPFAEWLHADVGFRRAFWGVILHLPEETLVGFAPERNRWERLLDSIRDRFRHAVR